MRNEISKVSLNFSVQWIKFLLTIALKKSCSSRRLEVSRVELLLQVGTFCVAVGALVAGIEILNFCFVNYVSSHVISQVYLLHHS